MEAEWVLTNLSGAGRGPSSGQSCLVLLHAGECKSRIEKFLRRFSFAVIAARKQVWETEGVRRSVVEQGHLPGQKIRTNHTLGRC
jgi:hypothetical protein